MLLLKIAIGRIYKVLPFNTPLESKASELQALDYVLSKNPNLIENMSQEELQTVLKILLTIS